MEDIYFTVRQSRAALARAIQVLRHTDEKRIEIMMSAANGFPLQNSEAQYYAYVYGKMFEVLLNDFDKRYPPENRVLQQPGRGKRAD